MARIFYSFALIIISPLIVFYLYILRGKKNQGYRAHFKERFGFVSKSLFTVKTKPLVFHCASVGEVLAATPLIKALAKFNGDKPQKKHTSACHQCKTL